MTTTSRNPWALKKAVLVYAPDVNDSCRVGLHIIHDQDANQGSVSLSIKADFANLSGRSLILNIPPERVEECGLARKSDDALCPPRLFPELAAPVPKMSDVSTLSLSLRTTGIVLCPSEMVSLSPATPKVSAFAKICQSQFLRLYISDRQFENNQLDELQKFCDALQQGRLEKFLFRNDRHGVVQKDWRVFSVSPDPPPYCQEPVSEQVNQVDPPLYYEQVVGKRGRDLRSVSPNDKRRKRLLLPSPQPIGSPTEVDTPSTLSPSPPSIRPTRFMRASPDRTACRRLTLLEHELRGFSDDQIRELLIRSGHQHLLAIPKDVDRDLSCGYEKVNSPGVEKIERRLKRYVEQYVDSAVSVCRDELYDLYTTNEAEFSEEVDDGKSDVRITANECMDDLKEETQKYMLEIEEQAQQYIKDIEDQAIKVEMSAKKNLRRWFDTSKSLLDSEPSPSQELGINARRSSI